MGGIILRCLFSVIVMTVTIGAISALLVMMAALLIPLIGPLGVLLLALTLTALLLHYAHNRSKQDENA